MSKTSLVVEASILDVSILHCLLNLQITVLASGGYNYAVICRLCDHDSQRPRIVVTAMHHIYMIFTGWEFRTGKISSRGLRSGPRPKAKRRF